MKTTREFLNAVIASEVSDEIKAFASAEIAKLDATNAKRKEKAAEKRVADSQYVDQFVGFLGSVGMTASDVLAKFIEAGVTEINGKELTVQKMSALAKRALADGRIAKASAKVAGKKGTCIVYTLAE